MCNRNANTIAQSFPALMHEAKNKTPPARAEGVARAQAMTQGVVPGVAAGGGFEPLFSTSVDCFVVVVPPGVETSVCFSTVASSPQPTRPTVEKMPRTRAEASMRLIR